MIYEQQTEVIVALISDAEVSFNPFVIPCHPPFQLHQVLLQLKGDIYWPTEKNQVVDHDSLSVSLQSSKSKPWGIERLIFITHRETRISRAVMHLQFTAWPPG